MRGGRIGNRVLVALVLLWTLVPIRLYETAFRFFDLGYAAAIGLSMLAVTILMANLFMTILKRRGLAR